MFTFSNLFFVAILRVQSHIAQNRHLSLYYILHNSRRSFEIVGAVLLHNIPELNSAITTTWKYKEHIKSD